jgi:isopenicillin N synthase-like dioxygenase
LKLVQERSGNALETIHIGNDFFSRTQVAQQLRERINKWGFMKIKKLCATKEMISKLKRLLTEWEKIFASYISDKGLITRIYRELSSKN